MRIAVIHHIFEADSPDFTAGYMVCALGRHWQQAGHEVMHLFGPDHYEPADVALLHVDLSVVPGPYLSLGRRYPRLLNRHLTDIRKRRLSSLRVNERDAYNGPVIVKTDLNHAGVPEKIRTTPKQPAWWKSVGKTLFRREAPMQDTKDYPIFDSIRDVPRIYFRDPAFIVEKFLPEKRDGLYYIRQAYFLGDRTISWLIPSEDPIARWEVTTANDTEIPTPPDLEEYRRSIRMDYGKIDYVEHEGRPVILDVNKTIGAGECPVTEDRLRDAIDSYFSHPLYA